MNKNLHFEEKPFFLFDENPPIKENQVFVILPFKNTLVFEKVIKPVLTSAGYICKKADDIFKTNTLMQTIANSIRESAIIIADLSEKNANVFYELGLAHAFNKRIILITQDDADVPSDLKAYKYYKYDISTSIGITNFEETINKLKDSIESGIITDYSRSIYEIYDTRGNEEYISSKILKQQEGSFLIWVYLGKEHIMASKEQNEWTYIISHATNNGNLKETIIPEDKDESDSVIIEKNEIRYYPNAWAIGRVSNKSEVYWRFWCNENDQRKIDLRSKLLLSTGWNLFSIIWSRDFNFIKFFINEELAGRVEFKFWPADLDDYMVIGTWRNRAKANYFNSKMGNWVAFKNAISHEKLSSFYNNNMPSKSANSFK